jgi:hypothetical protein
MTKIETPKQTQLAYRLAWLVLDLFSSSGKLSIISFGILTFSKIICLSIAQSFKLYIPNLKLSTLI